MFGMFSDDSIHDITANYQAWDAYIGQIWSNLFTLCHLKSDDVIIEIAPGSSSKMASALEKISFCGELHLIEPDNQLAQKLILEYKKHIPDATLHLHTDSLQNSYHKLPIKANALVSNHSIDDILLAETKYATPSLFQWAQRQKEQPIRPYQVIWDKLIHDPDEYNRCTKEIYHLWIKTIDHLQPNCCILSQYPSYHMAQHQLHALNKEASAILLKLKQHYFKFCIQQSNVQAVLNGIKNYNDPFIGNHILNAEHWLLLSFYTHRH